MEARWKYWNFMTKSNLPIALKNTLQSMGDYQDSTFSKFLLDCLLQNVVSFFVKWCGRFVHDEDFRFTKYGPRQAY